MTEFVQQSQHEVLHTGLKNRVEMLEGKLRELEKTIERLLTANAANSERLDMIIGYLTRIENRLDRFDQELKEQRARPSRLWDGFLLAILSAGMGGIITLLVQTILRR